MPASVIAAAMARESTRRNITEPPREPRRRRPRRPRRIAARTLQAVAHRLDPYVTAPPQVRVTR
jgi:hypothetical protein